MPPKIPPLDRRKRRETKDLNELNDAIRKGDWELFKFDADSVEGFTYTLVERKADKSGGKK